MQKIKPQDYKLPGRAARPATEPPVAAAATTPQCPRCADLGWYVLDVEFGHPQFGKLQPCDCEAYRQQAAAKLTKLTSSLASELGIQHTKCTFETFDAGWSGESRQTAFLTGVKNCCADYAVNPTGWLMLHGKKGDYCGNGKSHLAAAIANSVAARGVSVAYATVPDLFAYVMRDWSKSEERIDQLGSVGLLVMDDAGKESVRGGGIDMFKDKFFRVLGKRDREQLPVVITSNYTLEELAQMDHYDPAVISRIAGQTEGRRIQMTTADYRRRPTG